MVNWFLTRVPRQINRERTVFSTNGAGTTDHLHVKGGYWIPTSHHIEKLTQNRSET